MVASRIVVSVVRQHLLILRIQFLPVSVKETSGLILLIVCSKVIPCENRGISDRKHRKRGGKSKHRERPNQSKCPQNCLYGTCRKKQMICLCQNSYVKTN